MDRKELFKSAVTKVVKGGKKLSFRAIVIVGNQKGQVGVGCAKHLKLSSLFKSYC